MMLFCSLAQVIGHLQNPLTQLQAKRRLKVDCTPTIIQDQAGLVTEDTPLKL